MYKTSQIVVPREKNDMERKLFPHYIHVLLEIVQLCPEIFSTTINKTGFTLYIKEILLFKIEF